MLLTEIDHVAIAVHDLEAAIAYYESAFGARVHHREVVERDGRWAVVRRQPIYPMQNSCWRRPESPPIRTG